MTKKTSSSQNPINSKKTLFAIILSILVIVSSFFIISYLSKRLARESDKWVQDYGNWITKNGCVKAEIKKLDSQEKDLETFIKSYYKSDQPYDKIISTIQYPSQLVQTKTINLGGVGEYATILFSKDNTFYEIAFYKGISVDGQVEFSNCKGYDPSSDITIFINDPAKTFSFL